MSFTWDELDQMQPRGKWRIPLPPTCPKCEYILTGLPQDRCPECGTEFKWREVRDRTARVWALTLRLRHANQDARLGVILALVGWFFIGFINLTRWAPLQPVFYLMALIAGVMAIILGSQVLNIRRVPKWAREYVGKPPPKILLGSAAMLLGFSLPIAIVIL